MANQRAADQVFLGIWISASLAQKIETARKGVARSQWVRDAIADLLRAKGIEVQDIESAAPNRVRTVFSGVNSAKKSPEEQFVDAIEAAADAKIAEEDKHNCAKRKPRRGTSGHSKKPTDS